MPTALRKIDGSFILNGDWRLSWPGIYEGAGTKFYYTRQDAKSMESIASTGPLDDPVDLMVRIKLDMKSLKHPVQYFLHTFSYRNVCNNKYVGALSTTKSGNQVRVHAAYE